VVLEYLLLPLVLVVAQRWVWRPLLQLLPLLQVVMECLLLPLVLVLAPGVLLI
jgi:hypothetical protein